MHVVPDFDHAVQIMDPKMDSGLLLNDKSSEVPFDVQQSLSPAQVMGIMDETLMFEVGLLYVSRSTS